MNMIFILCPSSGRAGIEMFVDKINHTCLGGGDYCRSNHVRSSDNFAATPALYELGQRKSG